MVNLNQTQIKVGDQILVEFCQLLPSTMSNHFSTVERIVSRKCTSSSARNVCLDSSNQSFWNLLIWKIFLKLKIKILQKRIYFASQTLNAQPQFVPQSRFQTHSQENGESQWNVKKVLRLNPNRILPTPTPINNTSRRTMEIFLKI